MSVVLNNEKLKYVFEKLHNNVQDNDATLELLAILKPVIKLTLDKFPQHLRDDIEQDIKLSIMNKRAYLTKAYLAGNIKNPTNYCFRLIRNTAIVSLHKELKHEEHLVSINDVKVEKAVLNKTYHKQKILIKVRDEVWEWLRIRIPNQKDFDKAARYLDVILEGQKPKFKNKELMKWFGGQRIQAKEAYSMVLQRVRDRLMSYKEEWYDKLQG